MSEMLRDELAGEAMDQAGDDWDNESEINRLVWGLKSDCPPLGIRMMSHMSWRFLPKQTKLWLFETWSESRGTEEPEESEIKSWAEWEGSC